MISLVVTLNKGDLQMASKMKDIKSMYNELANLVSSSPENWMEFLKFASRFQNYSFDVALMAYGQNRDATALATYDQWLSYGRQVKLREKGIRVGNISDGSRRLISLFDIKQTVGKEVAMRNWQPSDQVKRQLLNQWGYDHLHPTSFEDALYEEIANGTNGRYGEYQAFVQESIYQFCSYRLGMSSEVDREDIEALLTLRDAQSVSRAGNTIMNVSRSLLSEIALVIDQEKQEEKEHERRNLSGNESETSTNDLAGDSQFNSVHRGTGRTPISELSNGGRGQDSGSMGQFGKDVSKEEQPESSQLSDSDGTDHNIPKRSGRPISEGNRSVHGSTDAKEPGTEDVGHISGDAPQQSTSRPGEGAGSPGSSGDTELSSKAIEREEQSEGSTEALNPEEPSFFDESEPKTDEDEEFDLFNYQEKLEEKAESEKNVEKPRESIPSGIEDFFSLNRGYSSGAKAKFYDNLEAIRLLKSIEDQERLLTKEEQKALGKYVGWGGLANAFNPNKEDWSTEYKLLREALTEEEYRDARTSTLTSYYTDPEVISAIYGVLDRWGVNNGRLLDPAMGTGNFFSALPASMRQMERYGVEIDSLTGRISERLYPSSHVYKKGFQDVPFKENSFDVVVGNIPFNDIRILDPKYDKKGLLIHDYFFAKAIDVVKPGGIVAFITSRGSMDRQNSAFRKYINERAALIGAVRLPDNAFQKIAGTKVTTDILFLQKRIPGQDPDIGASWVKTVPYFLNEQIIVNEFYQENRFNILGTMKETSWIDGDTCVALPGRELVPHLRESLKNWNPYWSIDTPALSKVFTQEAAAEPLEEKITLPEGTHLFTYFISGDNVYFYSPEGIKPAPFKGVQEKRLKHLCKVRMWLNQVISLQMHDYKESDFQGALLALNVVYDAFVKEYGYISLPTNR
ncbi:MAG: helicase, partial [Neobacillus sp.]|nr:helicase [Neobacillus sp.]